VATSPHPGGSASEATAGSSLHGRRQEAGLLYSLQYIRPRPVCTAAAACGCGSGRSSLRRPHADAHRSGVFYFSWCLGAFDWLNACCCLLETVFRLEKKLENFS
jgi:hypothetical protein